MKFARNPSYGDDVKWLLNISKKLGECNTKGAMPKKKGASRKDI